MNQSQLKGVGFGCIAVTVILLFVAWERNDTNNSAVNAMKSFGAGGLLDMAGIESATPTATKYALVFAALAAAGAVGCFMAASKKAE